MVEMRRLCHIRRDFKLELSDNPIPGTGAGAGAILGKISGFGVFGGRDLAQQNDGQDVVYFRDAEVKESPVFSRLSELLARPEFCGFFYRWSVQVRA